MRVRKANLPKLSTRDFDFGSFSCLPAVTCPILGTFHQDCGNQDIILYLLLIPKNACTIKRLLAMRRHTPKMW